MKEIKDVITNLKNYGSNFDYQSYPLKKEEADAIISFYEKATSVEKDESSMDDLENWMENFINRMKENNKAIEKSLSEMGVRFHSDDEEEKKEEAEDIDAILTKDIDSYETAAANFRKQISQGMERVNRMQAQVEEMDNQLRNNFINV
jgi:hypothetical protein